MIGRWNTLRSFLSNDYRGSKLGIPLRIHKSRINHLTNSLTILIMIWSIGCPWIHKWRCNSRRCPKIRRRYLNTFIQILNSRLSSSRTKTKVKDMAYVLIFIVIGSFNNNWCRSLKSLFWVDLTVVNINHLRRVSGHAPRIGNRITIGMVYKKHLIWHESIPIRSLRSKIWRKTLGIGNNMPTKT